MRETAGSAIVPAAIRRNWRRGSVIVLPPLTADGHSALIPNSFIISQRFSASAFTSAPSASGVLLVLSEKLQPQIDHRERTAGSARASAAAPLSLLTISLRRALGSEKRVPNRYRRDVEPVSAETQPVSRPLPPQISDIEKFTEHRTHPRILPAFGTRRLKFLARDRALGR